MALHWQVSVFRISTVVKFVLPSISPPATIRYVPVLRATLRLVGMDGSISVHLPELPFSTKLMSLLVYDPLPLAGRLKNFVSFPPPIVVITPLTKAIEKFPYWHSGRW